MLSAKWVVDEKGIADIRAIPAAIDQSIAKGLADALYEEFYELLMETAQWSGYTTASWRVGWGMASGKESEDFSEAYRKLRKETPGLSAGHMTAVNRAAGLAKNKLQDYAKVGYRTGDPVIWNNSDQSEQVESGHVRDINKISLGAQERFKERMRSRVIEIELNEKLKRI